MRTILSFLLVLLGFTASYAQRLNEDMLQDSTRIIYADLTPALTPKGTLFPISIGLVYYGGAYDRYFIRLYSRYPLSDKDTLKIGFDDGWWLTFTPAAANVYEDRLGLIKKKKIYDVYYPVDRETLDYIEAVKINGISVGSDETRHTKMWKKNPVGEWLRSSYGKIEKRKAGC